MTKKLSASKQWMIDHPDDVPCPNGPDAAAAWRLKRGIYTGESEIRAQWAKYEAAMAEKRAKTETQNTKGRVT